MQAAHPDPSSLLRALTARQARMVHDLAALVNVESPSHELAAVDACAAALAELAHDHLGLTAERVVVDGHVHLRWRWGGHASVVLIGHFDTVWPLGTLAGWPFAVDGEGIARGPGTFDMKAGIVQALHALAVLGDVDGVALLLTSDEELGSQTSRALIEETVAGARAALVLEPSADGGALKTGRKGTSMYEVHITGRAAHAGLEPEKGANALVELAHQVLAIAELNSPAAGTTVTPTVASSGTTTNVVPDQAIIHVDVRATSVAEQLRIDETLKSLAARVPGVLTEVIGAPNRPPLPEDASAALFDRARAVAEKLGIADVQGVVVGGGSDGNFTAGVGIPTLDGLGAVGGGAHARTEHVHTNQMPIRAALLTALINDLRA